MAIRKEITKDNELYLWMNGKLIFKRWLDGGYSKVFEYKDDGHPMSTFIGDINFDENLIVEPGQRLEVLVRFLSCMPIEKYLNIDRKWWIHEGGKCIGEAIMKKIKFPEG